jgi:hypothetical protein
MNYIIVVYLNDPIYIIYIVNCYKMKIKLVQYCNVTIRENLFDMFWMYFY